MKRLVMSGNLAPFARKTRASFQTNPFDSNGARQGRLCPTRSEACDFRIEAESLLWSETYRDDAGA